MTEDFVEKLVLCGLGTVLAIVVPLLFVAIIGLLTAAGVYSLVFLAVVTAVFLFMWWAYDHYSVRGWL